MALKLFFLQKGTTHLAKSNPADQNYNLQVMLESEILWEQLRFRLVHGVLFLFLIASI